LPHPYYKDILLAGDSAGNILLIDIIKKNIMMIREILND
jgi:hypothetical protein